MTDSTTALDALRRPSLLIRAARFGLADYNRGRVLNKIFGGRVPAAGAATLDELIDHELRHDEIRRAGDASYSIAGSADLVMAQLMVEVLVALMAEARMLVQPPRVT